MYMYIYIYICIYIYMVYPQNFELFWAWLLRKRVLRVLLY